MASASTIDVAEDRAAHEVPSRAPLVSSAEYITGRVAGVVAAFEPASVELVHLSGCHSPAQFFIGDDDEVEAQVAHLRSSGALNGSRVLYIEKIPPLSRAAVAHDVPWIPDHELDKAHGSSPRLDSAPGSSDGGLSYRSDPSCSDELLAAQAAERAHEAADRGQLHGHDHGGEAAHHGRGGDVAAGLPWPEPHAWCLLTSVPHWRDASSDSVLSLALSSRFVGLSESCELSGHAE